MARFAAIDIGTNTVLLVVAEPEGGRFRPLLERAEITRLGRGVDRTRALAPEAIDDTVRVIAQFADEARRLGASDIAVSATSAARDAVNGQALLTAARDRAGVEVEILSGDLEAKLCYAATYVDFGAPGRPLVVIDLGGGSTEIIYGRGADELTFRQSFDVGSVRLTERFVRGDPLSPDDRTRIERQLEEAFAALPAPPPGFQAVGVAGTVTTIFTVLHAIEPYDSARVHGGLLTRAEIDRVASQLCALPLAQRRQLRGLEPKRADVIPAGALILRAALARLGAPDCRVSDRGLRWGLLLHRFGHALAAT